MKNDAEAKASKFYNTVGWETEGDNNTHIIFLTNDSNYDNNSYL